MKNIELVLGRIHRVNLLIEYIRDRGNFFEVPRYTIHILNKRIFYFTTCLSQKYDSQPKKLPICGTEWQLLIDFKNYIMTGNKLSHKNKYGGLYCPNWSYEPDKMKEILE